MWSKCLSFSAILAATAICGSQSAVLAQPEKQGEEAIPALFRAKPLENAPGDDELHKLLKARYNERLALTLAHCRGYRTGSELVSPTIESARRLLRAGMDLNEGPAERRVFLLQVDDAAKKLEAMMQGRNQGDARQLEARILREFQLEIAIEIHKTKKGATKSK
jgi:hypothetical protein